MFIYSSFFNPLTYNYVWDRSCIRAKTDYHGPGS